MNLDAADGSNMFTSSIADKIFGADSEFSGVQFHFHSGSEHTIDGKRFDLEMHTVHYPKDVENGFIAAAMGIIFSVEEYTANLSWSEQALIDTFFDSLKWSDMTEAGPTVDLVTYGSLMQMVDMSNRYIYKGSVTTPPCATFVYWNVLSTVYPISAKHVALFKKQLNRGEEGKLDEYGNFRAIQKEDEHNVIYLQSKASLDEKKGMVVAVSILAVTTAIGILVSVVLFCKIKKSDDDSKVNQVEMKEGGKDFQP